MIRIKASPTVRSLITAFLFVLAHYSAADSMVMIVSHLSDLPPLSRLELRKTYMGIPTRVNGASLTPLVNQSNSALTEKFHQHIVGMSKSSYDRKLMRNRLNYSADPPQPFTHQAEIFTALLQNKHAVSFMWLSELENDNASLKVLQVIWHQN